MMDLNSILKSFGLMVIPKKKLDDYVMTIEWIDKNGIVVTRHSPTILLEQGDTISFDAFPNMSATIEGNMKFPDQENLEKILTDQLKSFIKDVSVIRVKLTKA